MTIHLRCDEFDSAIRNLTGLFLDNSLEVRTRNWQGQDVTDREEMVPYELEDVTLEIPIMTNMQKPWADWIKPNLPWAENHFQERVSGIPHNPPPSHVEWPHAQAENNEFREAEIFSHTYPERFWPKYAGDYGRKQGNAGIRFAYGDLMDVVKLIDRDPHTRQAYLPVFFPEDTGAHHEQRIPCTLGYLFRYRREHLDIVYYIRSCDFRRHFRDDVYMAGRLAQWMSDRLREAGMVVMVGNLIMHIGSFHVFAGDLPLMKKEHTERMNRVLGSIW